MSDSIRDAHTTTKVVMALLMLGVIGWGTSITRTVNSVTRLEPQIKALQAEQNENSQWIAEWPSTGELSADVRQNERILQIAEELEETDEKIDEILDRLRDIEIQGVGN